MKKVISIIIAAMLTAALISAAVGAYTRPGNDGVVIVPATSDKITVDGTISDGEWTADALTLDENNLVGWYAGVFAGPIECKFAWGEDGLYIAADITDPDIGTNANTMFQIALDPGELIGAAYPGLFFSIGYDAASDNLTLKKHNWKSTADDGTMVDDFNGKYTFTPTGWALECVIPWSLIASADRTTGLASGSSLEGFKYDEEGAFCNATIAYVGQHGADVTATGRTTTGGSVTWNADSYDIKLTFEQPAPAETTDTDTDADTDADTSVDTSVDTDADTDTDTEDDTSGAVDTEPDTTEDMDGADQSDAVSDQTDTAETEPDTAEPEETDDGTGKGNPKTSDAAVIAIASVAAVALAGFVIAKKIGK